jgi:molybdate transport system substrate-binding protein
LKTRFLAVSILMLLAACRPEVGYEPPASPGSGKQLSGSATIFAAASLTESFHQIGEAFEEANPSTEIVFNFGASSGLATQVAEQGGADVFASADQANMAKVSDGGLLEGSPEVFAQNRLEIIVAPGNPKQIKGLSDLAAAGVKVVLAAPEVPAGRYAGDALDRAGVKVNPVSEAVDVKGVVGPVTLGEADAGIVYATDVTAAGGKAEGITIPEDQNVTVEYPIGLVEDGRNPQVGRAFIEFVLSDRGQEILSDHGFVSP